MENLFGKDIAIIDEGVTKEGLNYFIKEDEYGTFYGTFYSDDYDICYLLSEHESKFVKSYRDVLKEVSDE